MRNLIKKILKEQEDDLEWAKDLVSDMDVDVNIGDVFYIVDNAPQQNSPHPDDYRPTDVRYIITVVNITFNAENELIIKYKACNPENTTYNANDYSVESPRCYDYEDGDSEDVDEDGYEDVPFKWFRDNLTKTNYWRKMK
jgi:hypothetical protein